MNKINKLLYFAAMTAWLGLGAVLPAQAQIAFRAAQQATSAAGLGATSAITFVAAGAQLAGTGATITPVVIPGGTAAGDFAVLIVAGRPSDTSNPAAPAGWTFRSSSLREVGANDLKIMTFYRVLTGGDTNPTVTLPANWQGAARGMSAQIAVWRGVDTTTPFDVADVTGNSVAVQNWTPPAITTVTNNAVAVSAVASSDDNRLRFNTANGFTARMSDTAYDTTTGGDHAVGVADKLQAVAGAVTMVQWQESSNNNDPWAGITFALRPSPPTPDTLTIAVPAGTTIGDVMIASITVRPCSNTNGGACTVTLTAPAGWIQVGTTIDQTGGGGTGGFGNRLAVYQRVVTGVEPANYTWTFGGTVVHAGAVGGISTFSGVDTASPVVVQGGQVTAASYNHATPDINTGAVTNTMLVSTHAANSAATWVPVEGTLTEAVDGSSLAPTDNLGISMAVYYEPRAAAGLTGTRTATHSNPPANDTGTTHMLALRPGVTFNHYAITAPSGANFATCEPAVVRITAHDAAHNPVNPATGTTLTIRTSTNTGIWQAFNAGAGDLGTAINFSSSGANNGQASYTWSGTESVLQVRLRHNTVVTPIGVNLNPSGSPQEDATEDPAFNFYNSVWRITADGSSVATVNTQIAGKESNIAPGAQTLFVQAVATAPATGACTTLFQNQTLNVEFAAVCNNPATCSGVVGTEAAILNSGSTYTNIAKNSAPSSYTNVSLAFSNDANAMAPFAVRYGDAGQITIHMRYALPVTGDTITGSSNAFVVRPFGLAFPGVTHGVDQTSSVLAAAGDNFPMSVTAYLWNAAESDGSGNPRTDITIDLTDNGVTPNFAAATTVAVLALSNLPGVQDGVLTRQSTGTGDIAVGEFASGAAPVTDWRYSEAGNVTFTAAASNYLGSGAGVTGRSTMDGTGNRVGRFRPKKFAVSGAALTNRTLAACTPSPSSFTYMDEGLTLAFTLTAQNTQNGQTMNYTGVYAKHDPTTAANYGIAARNVTPFKDLTAGPRTTSAYVTVAPTWSNGVLNVTGANAAVTTVARPTPANPPDGPYTEVQFGIAPTDTDGVLMAAYDLDIDNSGSNDHTAVAPTTVLRYGRLRLGAASGSALLPLRVPMEAQYWNGTFFITNTSDSCTALVPNNVGLGNIIGGIVTSVSTVSALQLGRGTITLAQPTGGARGSVDLAVNLSGPVPAGTANADACPDSPAFAPATTAAANMSYLRGLWCATTPPGTYKDPSTRARFGIQRGSDETIYTRENY